MYRNTFKGKLLTHLSNLPGWRTTRKIVVFESDDWGSIRTKDINSFNNMLKNGLQVKSNHYNAVDSLESNADLERLFETLLQFRDSTARPPVFTPLCIMGNPDFDKIEKSGFTEYFFQPLDKTLEEYPEHDKVLFYWKAGRDNRLFVPALHGREHINVRRFMDLLKSGDEGMRISFNNRSVGVSSYYGKTYPNYLGALHPTSLQEIKELHEQLRESGKLFELFLGEKPAFFVAPNAEEPKELENTLDSIGIRYIGRAKRRIYPVGDGTFKKEWNWIGKKNELGQTILTRNCFFEPVAWGEHHHVVSWVDNCLKEIEIAFKWNKPAVISTHRVNYIGNINKSSRERGLQSLTNLISKILIKWPESEFMTSMELGALISK